MAYVRTVGRAAGAAQEFGGPTAKQRRMFTIVAIVLYLGLAPQRWQPRCWNPGIWSIANTLPQVLSPTIAGLGLDALNRQAPNLGYTAIFSTAVVSVVCGFIFVWKIKNAK